MQGRISKATGRDVIPVLRIAGFTVLSLLIGAHNRLITPQYGPNVAWGFALVSLAYSLAALLLLKRVSSHDLLQRLTFRFAELDLVFWAAAVYCTGMDQSWLIGLLLLRAADQMSLGSTRVLWIAQLSTFAYAAALALYRFNGHVIENPGGEMVKLVCLYCFNLYIYAGTRAVDRLNDRMRQTQAALLRAKASAESASQAKSRLMANVTHELRTPLNAILGYTQLLRETLGEASAKEMDEDLAKIEQAGNHLLEMVNRVLDLSKIEAGKMQLHKSSFDPKQVAEKVVHTIAPLARKKGNAVVLDVDPALGHVFSDSLRFQQSLLNLMGNACKFTEQGTIRLSLRADSSQGQPQLVAEVADTGIGISADYQDKIFQAFAQGDPLVSQKYGGTGLGLSLTRQMCELLGGDLQLQSAENKGTTITIRIPAA